MSETSIEPERIQQPEVFRRRELPAGGTLFILEQSHRTNYPKADIEKDIREISPHILILENTMPVGPALHPGEAFAEDVRHQLSLAKELNIPVVFPDISGVITPEDSLVDTNYWSVFTDTSKKTESSQAAPISQGVDLQPAISLGSSLMAIGLGAKSVIGVEIGLTDKKKLVIKVPKQISRRDFLKLAALGTVALTIPLAFPRAPSIPGAKNIGEVAQNIPKVSDKSIGEGGEVQAPTSLAKNLGDQEKLESFVYGLRNAKFISIAEQASEKLDDKRNIKEPKVGLVVGQGHGSYIADTTRNADKESRSLAATGAISEVFLPTYHWLINSVAKENDTLLAIKNRALLDLAHITVAGIYQVTGDNFEVSEKSTRAMGYLISKEIQQGIETALRSEPELLAAYKQKMSELERFTY